MIYFLKQKYMSKKHRKSSHNKAFIVRSLAVVAFTFAIAALPVAAKYFTAAVTGSDGVFIAQDAPPPPPPPGGDGPPPPPPGGDFPPPGGHQGPPPGGDHGGFPPPGGHDGPPPQGGTTGQPPQGGTHQPPAPFGSGNYQPPGDPVFCPALGIVTQTQSECDSATAAKEAEKQAAPQTPQVDTTQPHTGNADGPRPAGNQDFSNPIQGCEKAGGNWCADQSGNPESGWCAFGKSCSEGYDPSDQPTHSPRDDFQGNDRYGNDPYGPGYEGDAHRDGRYEDDRYKDDRYKDDFRGNDRYGNDPYGPGYEGDARRDGRHDDRYDEEHYEGDFRGEPRHDGPRHDDPRGQFFGEFGDEFGGFPGPFPGGNRDHNYNDFGFGHYGDEDGPRDFKDFQGVDFGDVNDRYKDGGFGDYDYGKEFEKFEFNLDREVNFDREKENVARKVREISEEGKNALRDIKNFEREVERAVKRSAGLEACPPIASAKAAIASAKTAAEIMAAATEDNIEQAIAAAEELGYGGGFHGGPGGPGGFPGPFNPGFPAGPDFGPGGQGGFNPEFDGFQGPGGFGPDASFVDGKFGGGFGPNFGGGFGPNPAGYGTELFKQGPDSAGYGTELFKQGPDAAGYGTELFNKGPELEGGFERGSNFGANIFGFGAAHTAFSPLEIDYEELLWHKVTDAVGRSHMCEGVTHFIKEVGRMKKQVNRDLKRIKDAEIQAKVEKEVLVPLTDLETDPYSKADFEDTYGDPMRDLFETMEDLRWVFEDIMDEVRHGFQEDNICGTLRFIQDDIARQSHNIPETLLAQGGRIIEKGLVACQSKDFDTAREAMGRLHGLKDQFERYMDIDEEDHDHEDAGFGKLDAKQFLKDSIEAGEGQDVDALLAKLEARMLSKMEAAVTAAVNEANKKWMAEIAKMESAWADKLGEKMASTLDNVEIGYSGELKEKVMAAKSKVTEATTGLDKIVNKVEKELDSETKNNYEELLEYATVRNFSTTGATAVQKQIDAAVNAMAVAKDNTEAAETAKEEIATALKNVKSIYDADEGNLLKEGILKFADLHGQEDAWFTGYGNAAHDANIVKGEKGEDGFARFNASRETNVAEGVVMMARAANCESAPVDTADGFIGELPEWAQGAASCLKSKKNVDFGDVLGSKGADQSMTRMEMIQIGTKAFDFKAKDVSGTLAKFNDVAGLDADEKAAAAAMVEAGILAGEGGTNNLNPEGALVRAAFAKIATAGAKAAQ